MAQTQFYEDQIFENEYPPEAAQWCNETQATDHRMHIEEIDALEKVLEDGTTKTTRRFQIVKSPDPTEKEKVEFKRQERDYAIKDVLWLLERHQQEKILGVPTTLSASEHLELLEYIQTLRDIPQQPDFPYIDLPQKPSFLTPQSHSQS